MPPKKETPAVNALDVFTDDKIKEMRRDLSKVTKAARGYGLDLTAVARTIEQVAADLPAPPREVTDGASLKKAQRWMIHTHRLRTRLGQTQQACQRSKAAWGGLIEVAKRWFWCQPESVALKNDTQRMHIMGRILPQLLKKYDRVKGFLVEIDSLLWILKDNQNNVSAIMSAWRDETWAYRHGMEG